MALNEALETTAEQVEQTEQQEAAPTSQAPPWDYSPQAEQQAAQGLTAEQVDQIVARRLAAAQAPEPGWEDQLIDKATAKSTQQMEQYMARVMAPLAQTQLASHIGRGLPDEAQEFLRARLSKYDATAVAGIASSKDDMDLLRMAAERFVDMKKGPVTVAPKAETVGAAPTQTGGATEAQIDRMWESWKSVPGMTREAIAKMAREAA